MLVFSSFAYSISHLVFSSKPIGFIKYEKDSKYSLSFFFCGFTIRKLKIKDQELLGLVHIC